MVDNNLNTTHNLLAAIVASGLDIHVVYLGIITYPWTDSAAGLPGPSGGGRARRGVSLGIGA